MRKRRFGVAHVKVTWLEAAVRALSQDFQPVDIVVEEMVAAGVAIHQRPGDIFLRLVDLGMCQRNQSGIALTSLGMELRNALMRSPRRFCDYLHMWHYVHGYLEASRVYFATYRYSVDVYWREPTIGRDDAYVQVGALLAERYPDIVGQSGFDKAHVGHSLEIWRKIMGGKIELRDEVEMPCVLQAIQLILYARGLRPVEPLLLSPETQYELCRFLLLRADALGEHLQRAIRLSGNLTESYSLAGSAVALSKPVVMV